MKKECVGVLKELVEEKIEMYEAIKKSIDSYYKDHNRAEFRKEKIDKEIEKLEEVYEELEDE